MAPQAPSIAIVTGSVSRLAGGLFYSVRQLARGLDEAGARVAVFGLRDDQTDADVDAWKPLSPVVLNPMPTRGIGFAKGLHEALTAFRPTIIHQHGIWQAYSKTVSHWSQTVPTVISPRGMLDPWALQNANYKKRLAWYAWEGKNLRSAACIHALAESEATAVKTILPHANVPVIPNAVEMPALAAKKPHRDGKKNLLFLGRLHPKKGLKELIGQLSNLETDLRKDWTVTIAGPDEDGHKAELERDITARDLADVVDFVGPAFGPKKEALLQQADAFILPSHSEGLPMAVLEAWAYGLPVLMTKACNLPEGFTAGAALEIDHDAAGVRLAAALNHPDLKTVGQRGRELAQSRFALPAIVNAHLTNYDVLLAKRAA